MKPRILDVLDTMKNAVALACQWAGIVIPGQVIVGFPIATELVKILGQRNEQILISVNERPGSSRNVTRYSSDEWMTVINPLVPLAVETIHLATGGAFEGFRFSGAVIGGLNVHAFFGSPQQDVYYQTTEDDTLATVAAAIAGGIVAPGVSASASGADVIVAGTTIVLNCNVGGQTSLGRLVGLNDTLILVSIWTPTSEAPGGCLPGASGGSGSAATRWLIADAIVSSIGTDYDAYLYLSDGSPIHVERQSQWIDDAAQSSYSLYLFTLAFYVEYGILKTYEAAQIESVEATAATQHASVTITSGGL